MTFPAHTCLNIQEWIWIIVRFFCVLLWLFPAFSSSPFTRFSQFRSNLKLMNQSAVTSICVTYFLIGDRFVINRIVLFHCFYNLILLKCYAVQHTDEILQYPILLSVMDFLMSHHWSICSHRGTEHKFKVLLQGRVRRKRHSCGFLLFVSAHIAPAFPLIILSLNVSII